MVIAVVFAFRRRSWQQERNLAGVNFYHRLRHAQLSTVDECLNFDVIVAINVYDTFVLVDFKVVDLLVGATAITCVYICTESIQL